MYQNMYLMFLMHAFQDTNVRLFVAANLFILGKQKYSRTV